MADFLVSRIQHRRGLQVNLPQPLRIGELGWCLDTNRLFIGGDPNEVPPGVQITPNNNTIAQSILDNQIIVIAVDDNTFDISSFETHMNIYVPSIQIKYFEDGFVYVVINSGQIASYPIIEAHILSFGASILSVTQGAGVTVSNIGTFAVLNHNRANAYSNLLNLITGIPLAITKLNVEIVTEQSDLLERMFLEYILTPVGIYTDIPNGGISYEIDEVDSFQMNYSLKKDSTANDFSDVGTMNIVSSIELANANLSRDSNEIRTPALPGSVDFRAQFVAPNVVKMQYRNTFSDNVTFALSTIKWRSF